MPFTAVDATPEGTSSNSYATVAQADTYHQGHTQAATWDAGTTETKSRSLISATRMLDTWFEWFGDITTLTQALSWPRSGVLRPNVSQMQPAMLQNTWHTPFGGLLNPHTIPAILVNATSELARQLLDADREADNAADASGLKSIDVAGAVAIEFRDGAGSLQSKPIPDAVMAMCTQIGIARGKSGAGTVTVLRG